MSWKSRGGLPGLITLLSLRLRLWWARCRIRNDGGASPRRDPRLDQQKADGEGKEE
jgi:hypothetical protein